MLEDQDRPEFDLEEFMHFSRETRISAEALNALLGQWEKWSESLQKMQADGLLAIWLPEEAELEIDRAWQKSPSEGFMLNNLAQYLCMATVAQAVPQIADLGCAPTPEPDPGQKAELEKAGAMANGSLRRYAVLTHMPFRGGCEACTLSESCPRLTGGMDGMTATLPGFERGNED